MASSNPQEATRKLESRIAAIEAEIKFIAGSPSHKFEIALVSAGKWLRVHWKSAIAIVSFLLIIPGYFINAHMKYNLDHKDDEANRKMDERIRTFLDSKDGVNQTLMQVKRTAEKTDTKLDTLTPLINQILQRDLGVAAQLTQQSFQQHLGAVNALLKLANYSKPALKADTLPILQSKLLRTPTSADQYWPTAAQLISLSLSRNLPDQKADIRKCTDSSPQNFVVTEVGPIGDVRKIAAHYENCQIELGLGSDMDKLTRTSIETKSTVIFSHCVITYSGKNFEKVGKLVAGPVTIKGPVPYEVAIETNSYILLFDKCQFNFSSPNQLPENGQGLLLAILNQVSRSGIQSKPS